jgi:ATP-dependent Clp protease ATP-binding subunit ClpA
MAKIHHSPEMNDLYEYALAPDRRKFSAEYFLVALARKENCIAASLLQDGGFDPVNAIEQIQQLQSQSPPDASSDGYSGVEGIFIFGTIARRVASTFHSKCANSEHLLLALLHRHRDGAYRLLGRLGVNRERLQIRSSPCYKRKLQNCTIEHNYSNRNVDK